MPIRASAPVYLSNGFQPGAHAGYLFDIDGTLLNCQDGVHFMAFHNAFREVLGVEPRLEGVPLHGNTDVGILRAALEKEGLAGGAADWRLDQIVHRMCAEVSSKRADLRPNCCPAIQELLHDLSGRGKLLGAASGNLEAIGWMKLESAGLKPIFSFGAFAWPRESRSEIVRLGVSLARQRLGQAATICLVGDTPADVEAGRAADVPVIAVATGIHAFSELLACKPDACFADASHWLALASAG